MILPPPSPANDWHGDFIARVTGSFARVTGGDLVAEAGLDPAALGRSAWEGRFALLTHRGDADATLNYANRFALSLWALDWERLCAMPSRLTAPPDDRPAREVFMRRVAEHGFARGYEGRRVASDGRLFAIRDALVWRLTDESGAPFGAAAFFKAVTWL